MGSVITLSIDELDLDYGKNAYWTHHGQLFQLCDYRETDPYENEEHDEDARDCDPRQSPGKYVRTLKELVGRLDLLGFTEQSCRDYIHANAPEVLDNEVYESAGIDDAWVQLAPEHVIETIARVNIDDVLEARRDYRSTLEREPHRKKWLPVIRARAGLESMPLGQFEASLNYAYLEIDYGDSGPDELCHPYVVLRLLAAQDRYSDRELVWDFSDLVLGGWAVSSDFAPYLDASSRVLVVTEGSTDLMVIRKALNEIRPDVAEFFHFVDMDKNYPFTGTGNLYKFCQGLTSIKIQNKVLVVYDNDAEGVFNYQRTRDLECPPHMGLMVLPSLEVFSDYPTIGPGGSVRSNINGRAVSIELFLGGRQDEPDPVVRWSSYHEKARVYQGVVEGKSAIVKRFLNSNNHAADYPRVSALIDALIHESTRISMPAHKSRRGFEGHPWTTVH